MAKMDEESSERSPEELPPETEEERSARLSTAMGRGEPSPEERDFRPGTRSSFDLRAPTFSLGIIFRGSEQEMNDVMLMLEKQGVRFAYTTGLRASKLRIVNYNPRFHGRGDRRDDRRPRTRSDTRRDYTDQQQQQSERSY